MEQEDNEFFVLVLGVLAAIILVISWWFTTGGTAINSASSIDSATTASHNSSSATDSDHDRDDRDDSDDDRDGRSNDGDDDRGDRDDRDEDHDGDESDDSEFAESADDVNADVLVADRPTTVFDVVATDDRLGVLNDLIRSEGLDVLLSSEGPFTMFAPTDDAINDAAASDTTVSVLESERKEVLEYHVVPGSYTFEQLTSIAGDSHSTQLTTLQGEALDFSLDGTDLVINRTTVIDGASLPAGSGLVHILDNVLVPPVAALNALVDLEPILFASGSDEIDQQSFATLDRFTEVLLQNAALVTIEGHTDSSGDALRNETLSQDRARAVLNYLVANGIDESLLTARGFGSSQPVADNETEQGRALNRRIEFSVD